MIQVCILFKAGLRELLRTGMTNYGSVYSIVRSSYSSGEYVPG